MVDKIIERYQQAKSDLIKTNIKGKEISKKINVNPTSNRTQKFLVD